MADNSEYSASEGVENESKLEHAEAASIRQAEESRGDLKNVDPSQADGSRIVYER